AYENSLKTTGIDLKTFFTSSDMAIPIVHAEIDFYQPLFCGDTLQINLIGTKLNETDFEIIYNIFHESFLNKSVAQAKTKHVSINPQIRKRSPFSPLIIQWLEQISANVNQV
nr:1,4-dihydroxy-2-naphthoyl-CoA hydrolase [Crocosphaera sp.]